MREGGAVTPALSGGPGSPGGFKWEQGRSTSRCYVFLREGTGRRGSGVRRELGG